MGRLTSRIDRSEVKPNMRRLQMRAWLPIAELS